MFNQRVLAPVLVAVFAFAVSATTSLAEDAKKTEPCPTSGLDAIADLIRQAPSCRRAIALFEICEFSASGDVALGAAATEKCEGDFLAKLSPAQKRAYDRGQKLCAHKYQNQDGTMYRSFEAFCGAYVARDYSARFLKATGNGSK